MERSDSDDNEGGPAVPRGVLRAGWKEQGREELANRHASGVSAAVDLQQFRNTEVGKGYQARHVVRQSRAEPERTKIVDKSAKSKKHKHVKKQDKTPVTRSKEDRVKYYLQSSALRRFRKELEKIK